MWPTMFIFYSSTSSGILAVGRALEEGAPSKMVKSTVR